MPVSKGDTREPRLKALSFKWSCLIRATSAPFFIRPLLRVPNGCYCSRRCVTCKRCKFHGWYVDTLCRIPDEGFLLETSINVHLGAFRVAVAYCRVLNTGLRRDPCRNAFGRSRALSLPLSHASDCGCKQLAPPLLAAAALVQLPATLRLGTYSKFPLRIAVQICVNWSF